MQKSTLFILTVLIYLNVAAQEIKNTVEPSSLITNVQVIDGTGTPGRKASVRFSGNKIIEIGELKAQQGELIINGNGMVLAPGFIDSHDIVVRINNYKTGAAQGYDCDCFYSFFGTSIKKQPEDLLKAGVKLLMCKCPNSKPLESAWHEKNKKEIRTLCHLKERSRLCQIDYSSTYFSFLLYEKNILFLAHLPIKYDFFTL